MLLNVVDQVVGSIERHAQMSGDTSGNAKDQLPGIDFLLKTLALLGDLPAPRGDHYTYWWTLYSGGRQLTHMGTDGERAFGDAVRGLDQDQRDNALVLLAPIVDGSISVTSKDAVERMRAAVERETLIRDRMLHLWKRAESGERNLPIKTFTVGMRTYLVGYHVDGVLHSGPNAANVAGQVLYDLTLGVLDADYKTDVVPTRVALMDSTDRGLVNAALEQEQSVLSRVLAELPITALQLGSYSPQMIAGHLTRLPPETIAMLDTFVTLVAEGGKIWGTHQSEINTYLVHPDREVPAEELTALPVPPTHGTGGHTHSETEALMRMRARNGIVKAIKDALAVLANPQPV